MSPMSLVMRKLIPVIPLVMFVSVCPGQDAGVNPEELQAVDGRVEDVSVLSTSLRVNSTGLGHPAGFDQVYRAPGSMKMFMRGNGALFAFFDQSVYSVVRGYSVAEVPPSTVFHIGMPYSSLDTTDSQPPPVVASVEDDLSKGVVRAGFGVVAPAGPETGNRIVLADTGIAEKNLPRFVSDREYRARRLAEILSRRLEVQGDQPR